MEVWWHFAWRVTSLKKLCKRKKKKGSRPDGEERYCGSIWMKSTPTSGLRAARCNQLGAHTHRTRTRTACKYCAAQRVPVRQRCTLVETLPPSSRRTHMMLRSRDRRTSNKKFYCRCCTQNTHVLHLLAVSVYHPTCGWSESSVGGTDATNNVSFSLQWIFNGVKCYPYHIFEWSPLWSGETRQHSHWQEVLYFLQQVDTGAEEPAIHRFSALWGKYIDV